MKSLLTALALASVEIVLLFTTIHLIIRRKMRRNKNPRTIIFINQKALNHEKFR